MPGLNGDVLDSTELLDFGDHSVTGLQEHCGSATLAYAMRASCEYQVTDAQFDNAAEITDNFSHAKDHVTGCRILILRATYAATNVQRVRKGDFVGGREPWANRRKVTERLAQRKLRRRALHLQRALR